MERKEINVYTNLNNNEQNYKIMAIINNDVIKYIDLANNKMFVDVSNDIITRENESYKFIIDLRNNDIEITHKKMKKIFNKEIKTLLIQKNKKDYLVRYQLIDDNIINEIYLKF